MPFYNHLSAIRRWRLSLNHHLEREGGCKLHLGERPLIPLKQSLNSGVSRQFYPPMEVLSQKALSPYPELREHDQEDPTKIRNSRADRSNLLLLQRFANANMHGTLIPGTLLKGSLDSAGLGWGLSVASLTSAQVRPMLLVHGPHCDHNGSTACGQQQAGGIPIMILFSLLLTTQSILLNPWFSTGGD